MAMFYDTARALNLVILYLSVLIFLYQDLNFAKFQYIDCVQLTSSAMELQESELIAASFVLASLADYLYRQDSTNVNRTVLEQQAGCEYDCIMTHS